MVHAVTVRGGLLAGLLEVGEVSLRFTVPLPRFLPLLVSASEVLEYATAHGGGDEAGGERIRRDRVYDTHFGEVTYPSYVRIRLRLQYRQGVISSANRKGEKFVSVEFRDAPARD